MVRNETDVRLGLPVKYRITIQGELDMTWSDWLSVQSLTVNHGTTTIIGTFEDQVALHGLLEKIRNLGLPLLSICRENSENE
jgi:hypothetical protein